MAAFLPCGRICRDRKENYMQDFFEELGSILFLLLTGIGICAVYIHFVQLID
ncbi:hypothetical protein AR1Y2_0439 [Anaerostipes rhamnosivorans]|uniref:Uncharacterized protein n=1 Tax=Anaerostipes rhamnosivorans TaxID=1229621 RepID=A0A4P8IDQ3_9FIRM|nr:hypothetical protein AR1Y2_0439 [Anaerostipes rhamnosivorans]